MGRGCREGRDGGKGSRQVRVRGCGGKRERQLGVDRQQWVGVSATATTCCPAASYSIPRQGAFPPLKWGLKI